MGDRIKQLRHDFGVSQKELAQNLAIGHSTLACYETNRRQVPNDLIVALARYFKVTTDYLLGADDMLDC